MKQILNKHYEIPNQGIEMVLQATIISFVTQEFLVRCQKSEDSNDNLIAYANNTLTIENSKLTLDLVLSAKMLKIDISAFSDKDEKALLNDDAIRHFKYIEETLDSYQQFVTAYAKGSKQISELCLKHDELYINLAKFMVESLKANKEIQEYEKKQQLN